MGWDLGLLSIVCLFPNSTITRQDRLQVGREGEQAGLWGRERLPGLGRRRAGCGGLCLPACLLAGRRNRPSSPPPPPPPFLPSPHPAFDFYHHHPHPHTHLYTLGAFPPLGFAPFLALCFACMGQDWDLGISRLGDREGTGACCCIWPPRLGCLAAPSWPS